MQSKDINHKSTEHDTLPSFHFTSAAQAHPGLCTLDENWSSFSIQYRIFH